MCMYFFIVSYLLGKCDTGYMTNSEQNLEK